MNLLNYFIPLLLSSLWMRISYIYAQISTDDPNIYAPLLRGVASDTSITFLLALTCTAVARLRFAPLVLCGLYCFMLAANVEFMVANDANIDFFMLNQALDESFINGAVLTAPMGWRILQSLGIFSLVFALLRFLPALHIRRSILTAIGAASTAFLIFTPIFEESTSWMQMNPLEDNIDNLAYTLRHVGDDTVIPTHISPDYIDRFFTKELGGKKILPYPESKPNVLMIVLESVGQVHLTEEKMPHLQSLTETLIHYPNFVVESQVTVNGLYALLCADKPGFTTPNVAAVKAWTLKNKNNKRFCLPQMLNANGYQTVYMQSAPLKFQRKETIMPMFGFEEVLGKNQLDAKDDSAWGSDDKKLYNHALKKIDTLETAGNPWFMTIMTITTHYPAVVPDEFFVMRDGNKVQPPHLYADLSLEYFLTELERKGVLDNTLVVITNDEVRAGGKTVKAEIDKNNGVLIIRTPTQDKATIKDYFTQSDMFLSLADYLGLPTDEIPMGRSIFREHSTVRPIFFSNFFSKKFYVYPGADQLLVCKGKPATCSTYRSENHQLFGGIWDRSEPLKQWRALIQAISKRNDPIRPLEWNKTNASRTKTKESND